MKKTRNFFKDHPKLSYLGNFVITALGIFVFPLVFKPDFVGVIIGLVLSLIVIQILGLEWRPLSSFKNKR